jgi:hypothetical protein
VIQNCPRLGVMCLRNVDPVKPFWKPIFSEEMDFGDRKYNVRKGSSLQIILLEMDQRFEIYRVFSKSIFSNFSDAKMRAPGGIY